MVWILPQGLFLSERSSAEYVLFSEAGNFKIATAKRKTAKRKRVDILILRKKTRYGGSPLNSSD